MAEPVMLTIDDAVARVRLTRPEARNALNLAMCRALAASFAAIEARPDLRVVLISAEGPSFCGGADLKERQGRDAEWVRQRRMGAFAAFAAISGCSRPVVTLVHGHVVGSGGEIALAGDFIVAAEDARFRFPEVGWGTVGATQRLQRAIGRQRAKDMLLTGRAMDATEALAAGLVARVVPAAELEAAGSEIARAIAAAPPLAVRLTKQAMDIGATTDLASAIRVEQAAIDHSLDAGEWTAGLARFAADKTEKAP
jgi:enoyl-CoA hydratase/carnithine racemase